MKKYKQGDIILIPYPYTDLSATKTRPAVIISKSTANKGNYIVVKVTSVIRNDSFSFPLTNDILENNLIVLSEARTNEIFTVSETIVRKHISAFKPLKLRKLLEKVKKNISYEQ